MSDELGRHKAALGVAFKALNMVATATDVSLTAVNTCAETALARIAELFPPEFEDVPVVRWECQMCGFIHKQDRKPVSCAGTVNGSWCGEGDNFTKLTGTIKRPVKKPVVKEVEVEGVSLGGSGGICHWPGMAYGGSIFRDTDAAGKTVTLIARWTE